MEDLRKHIRDIEADFDPVHLAHTVHSLARLTYDLCSDDINLNDKEGWRVRLEQLCAVTYANEILALVAKRWLDRHMVTCPEG